MDEDDIQTGGPGVSRLVEPSSLTTPDLELTQLHSHIPDDPYHFPDFSIHIPTRHSTLHIPTPRTRSHHAPDYSSWDPSSTVSSEISEKMIARSQVTPPLSNTIKGDVRKEHESLKSPNHVPSGRDEIEILRVPLHEATSGRQKEMVLLPDGHDRLEMRILSYRTEPLVLRKTTSISIDLHRVLFIPSYLLGSNLQSHTCLIQTGGRDHQLALDFLDFQDVLKFQQALTAYRVAYHQPAIQVLFPSANTFRPGKRRRYSAFLQLWHPKMLTNHLSSALSPSQLDNGTQNSKLGNNSLPSVDDVPSLTSSNSTMQSNASMSSKATERHVLSGPNPLLVLVLYTSVVTKTTALLRIPCMSNS